MDSKDYISQEKLEADGLEHKGKYYPLTEYQMPFWIGQQANTSTSAYTISRTVELRGRLDIQRLEDCINEMIRKHDILRTTFHQINGQPMQKVEERFKFKIDCEDLRNIPQSYKSKMIVDTKEALEKRSWDLEKLPLFHLTIILVEDDWFWMVFNCNHLVFDGFSFLVFAEELSELYNSINIADQKNVSLQYVDYVRWVNQKNSNDAYKQEALDFYKHYLQNNEPVHLSFVNRNIHEVTSNKSEGLPYILPPQLAREIAFFAAKHRISKFTIMLSALFLLMAKHNKGEQITIALPVVNRYNILLLKMLGLFLNTSLISLQIDPEMTFVDFMQLIEEHRQKVHIYDSFPYMTLSKELKTHNGLNRSGFDILFNYLPARYKLPLKLNGLTTVSEDFNAPETDLLLSWYVIEGKTPDDLTIGCRTILELIDYKTVHILFWQYHSLLEQIVGNPERKLNSYSLLYRKDIDTYFRTISQTPSHLGVISQHTYYSDQVQLPNPSDPIIETDYPLVPHMIINHANDLSSQSAIVEEGHSRSYADLRSAAEAMANILISRNIAKGDVIAIHGEMSFWLCASVVGAWLAGGVILLIDSGHPANYKHTLVKESQSKHLITLLPREDNEMYNAFQDTNIISIDPVSDSAVIFHDKHEFPELCPDDPAYIFFTSGTTGNPKGIKGKHKGLSHFLNWQRTQFNIGPGDRIGQITNLSFDVIMREVFTPLISGATLYVPPPSHKIETGTYLDWMESNQITIQHIVPTLADFLLQQASSHIQLKSLRWLFFAGEPLPQRLIKQWKKAFPQSGNLVNLYGPTETTLAKAFYIIPPEVNEGIQPIGVPLPQTQIVILNKDRQLCGFYELGEICIRTPYRTAGYINAPEKDRDRFFPNPFRNDPDDLIYLSGDLGFLSHDGNIHISGRADDQIKVNGIRIDPAGISCSIAIDPNVKQCVVIGKKSADGNAKLISYIVPKGDLPHHRLREMLLANLRNKLPQYMIPHAIVFLDNIPVTPSGKLDKRALPDPGAQIEELAPAGTVRLPSTSIEKRLAAYWEKELKVSQVSLDYNFFDLGGDSLEAVKLMMFLREHYKIKINLRDLMANPTIEKLSEFIESGTNNPKTSALKLSELSQFTELPSLILSDVKSIEIKNIFITGAAGFLGSYLLNDLIDLYPDAKFYCLIRAKNKTFGLKKIYDSFLQFKLKNASLLKAYIIPVIGDLSEPYFGLSTEQYYDLCSNIDVIYHSGALVNFVYNFSQLKPSNVDGTITVIELSSKIKIKPIHYISTAGIYPASASNELTIIKDNEEIRNANDFLIGGYAQTKWVADQLMQKARAIGIPVTIYRPGRISWDTDTGMWQENDALYRFIFGCIQLGYFPDLPVTVDFNPVNIVSKAITYIASKRECENLNYNIVNQNQVSVHDLAGFLHQMGINTVIVPYSEWRIKLYEAIKKNQKNLLTPFLDLFAESIDDMPRLKYNRHFFCKNLFSALKGSTIELPKTDAQFFSKFMAMNKQLEVKAYENETLRVA